MYAALEFLSQYLVNGPGSCDTAFPIEAGTLHNDPKMGGSPFAPASMAPMLFTFVNDFKNLRGEGLLKFRFYRLGCFRRRMGHGYLC